MALAETNIPLSILQDAMLGVANSDGIHFFSTNEVIRCEALNNYTRFHFGNRKMLVVAKTLGEYESTLSSKFFLRIHRSDMVNIFHVRRHDNLGNLWLSDGTKLSIAKRRKVKVMETLRSFIL